VLLVTASRKQDLWIVPGGGIEPTEDPRVAALREVQEEAGAKGSLGRCLGVFEVYFNRSFFCLFCVLRLCIFGLCGAIQMLLLLLLLLLLIR